MRAPRRSTLSTALPALLLAAVALAGCGDETGSGAGGSGGAATPQASGEPASDVAPADTTGWRTEVFHDVALDVPSDWALGYAPVTDGRDVLECAVGPLGSDAPDGPDTTTPYVGRPGHGSDVCDGTGEVDLPEQDFVWFASPLEPGEYGTAERPVSTFAVGDERVTVGADAAVATAVRESARSISGDDPHGCPPAYVPETGYPAEGYGAELSMAVCAYQVEDDGLQRYWTTSLGADEADRLVKGVAYAPAARCRVQDEPDESAVMLRVTSENDFGKEPLPRDYVVSLGECPYVEDLLQRDAFGPTPMQLTPRIMKAWGVEGVRAYVGGASVPADVAPYFKAPQG